MDKIDLGRAFKAPFADTEWVKKTLFGWLWTLLVVTAPVVLGAQLDYIKSVSEGREELPNWDDFGSKWVRGFLLYVAYMIYAIPIWIAFFILLLPGIIAAAASNGNSGAGLFGGGMCLFSLVAIVYGIAMVLFLQAATVNYAMKGNFGALFEFGGIIARIRDGSGYFAAWLWAIVVSFAASIVMSVLSVVPVLGSIVGLAAVYLELMIMGHLFGQWAARSYGVAPMAAPIGVPGYRPPAGSYAPPAQPTAPPVYTPPAPPAPPVAPAAPAATPAPYTPPPAAPAAPPVAAPEAPVAPPAPYEPPTAPPAPPAGPDVPTS
jgi:hypothetical protein